MLRKMKKAAAWVLTSALLLSVGTPANAYAADPVYTVSEDDLKDGKLEIKGGSYAKIVVPEGLQAEEISLNGVTAAEFVVEGDIDAEINISGGSIAKVQVEEVKEEMPTLRDKAKLIRGGKTKSEADKEYKDKKQEVKEKKEKTPEIALKDSAAVKTIGVSGNAKLELSDGKVDTIAVSAKSSDMKVTVDGFKGKLVVEQKEEKSGAGHSTVELELNNSTIEKTEITGDGSASIVVSGTDSTITEAVVGGETSLVLGVETKKLETTEDSQNVALVILTVVVEVVINGAETSVDLTADAKVEVAIINGDNATVEGTGKVETVVTENETAKVETENTEVKTPEEFVPTAAPTQAPAVVPTTAPSTGGGSGSGGGGSWYPTATPIPTKAPTATPAPTETPDEPVETPAPTETPDEPTVTPTPGEEEEQPTTFGIYFSYDTTQGSVIALVDGKEVTKAASGSAVTVKATPAEGYEVEQIFVMVSNGDDIPMSDNTFIMPENNVKIGAVFVETSTPGEDEEPTVTPTPGETECEHKWDDGKVTTEPTCTTDGVKTYTCAICKETKTEVIEAVGHALETTKTTTTATCAAITVEVTKCSICEEYESTENTTWEETGIAHTWKESTDGTGWTCAVCGMMTTEDPVAGEDRTCENCTWTANWSTLTCSVCGKEVTAGSSSTATATTGALSVNSKLAVGEYTVILGSDINEVITSTASNLGISATSCALKIAVQSYTYDDENAPYSIVVFVEAHLISDSQEYNLQGLPSCTIYVPAAEAKITLGCWATGGGKVGTASASFASDKLIINGQMFTFYGIPK